MYETFMEKVKEVLEREPGKFNPNGYSRWGSGPEKGDPAVWISWTTGGQSGGSCWDTGDENPHYAVSGEPEPEFEELDKILEVVCPEINFLQYKAILREVVKSNNYTDNDYYGNYDTVAQKYVLMKDLYNALNSRNLGDW